MCTGVSLSRALGGELRRRRREVHETALEVTSDLENIAVGHSKKKSADVQTSKKVDVEAPSAGVSYRFSYEITCGSRAVVGLVT